MKPSTRILAGLFTIVIAWALFVVGEFFLEGEDLVMNPGDDPEAFGRIVTGGEFAFFAARGLIGVFLETVAFISLYLYLQNNRVEPVAFWGMITSVLGDFGGAVFFGMMLFVYPSVAPFIGGNAELAGYDFAFLGNIIHGISPTGNEELFNKIGRATTSRGMIGILDQFAGVSGSAFARGIASLLGLNLYLFSGGRSYPYGDVKGWLADAGFTDADKKSLRQPGFSLVVAGKSR